MVCDYLVGLNPIVPSLFSHYLYFLFIVKYLSLFYSSPISPHLQPFSLYLYSILTTKKITQHHKDFYNVKREEGELHFKWYREGKSDTRDGGVEDRVEEMGNDWGHSVMSSSLNRGRASAEGECSRVPLDPALAHSSTF